MELIDAETLRRTGGFEAFPGRAAVAIDYSADGRRLAVAGEGGGVGVWDAESGERLGALLRAPRGPRTVNPRTVQALAFGQGDLLAAAQVGGAVRIWDVGRRELLRPPLRLPPSVYGLAFSPDGSQLAIPFGACLRRRSQRSRDPRRRQAASGLRGFPPTARSARLPSPPTAACSRVAWSTAARSSGRPTAGGGWEVRSLARPRPLSKWSSPRTGTRLRPHTTTTRWRSGTSPRSSRSGPPWALPSTRGTIPGDGAIHPRRRPPVRAIRPRDARSAGRSIPSSGCNARAPSPAAASLPSSGKRSCPSRTTSRPAPRADDLDRAPRTCRPRVYRACTAVLEPAGCQSVPSLASFGRPGPRPRPQREAHNEGSHRHQHDPAATMASRAALDRPRYLCARDLGDRERRAGVRGADTVRDWNRYATEALANAPTAPVMPGVGQPPHLIQFTWRWCRAPSTTPSTRSTAGISRISSRQRPIRPTRRTPPPPPPRTTCWSDSGARGLADAATGGSRLARPALYAVAGGDPGRPDKTAESRSARPPPRRCSPSGPTTDATARSRSRTAPMLASGGSAAAAHGDRRQRPGRMGRQRGAVPRPERADAPDDGPNALTSAAYAEDYNEVKELGSLSSTTRTADETVAQSSGRTSRSGTASSAR